MNQFLLTIVLMSWFQSFPSFGTDTFFAGNGEVEPKVIFKKEGPREKRSGMHKSLSLDHGKLVSAKLTINTSNTNDSKLATGFSNEGKNYGSSLSPYSPMSFSPEFAPSSPEPSSVTDYPWDKEFLSGSQVLPEDLNHLGIIPDANRRWARQNGLDIKEGHAKWFSETAPLITQDAFNLGIQTLTLWFFSTDNWQRGDEEISNIMEQIVIFIDKIMPFLHEFEIKLVHIGRKDRLDGLLCGPLLKKLNESEYQTSHYGNFTLNLAIDYGGQDEIVRANYKCRQAGDDETNVDILAKYMDTGLQKYPAPDLVIRTGLEEVKTSGFFAYFSNIYKIYNTRCYAPDLKMQDLLEAFDYFNQRKRPFGK